MTVLLIGMTIGGGTIDSTEPAPPTWEPRRFRSSKFYLLT